MRVLKLKSFARFQRREGLSDKALCAAVRDLGLGLIDADLGGGLIKQRVARKGQGKSSGYRMLIAYQAGERAVFLFGFAKSERDNIGDADLASWRKVGRGLLALDDAAIEVRIADDDLTEVYYDEQDEEG